MSEYRPLSVKDVPAYLASVPALLGRVGDADELTCAEVGDGNLNLVFDVRRKADGRGAAVVKQALPYLRCAGEDWRDASGTRWLRSVLLVLTGAPSG